MNAPPPAEREALTHILNGAATDCAEREIPELMRVLKVAAAPAQFPGLLMTTLYQRLCGQSTTWCESAVDEAHAAARTAHQVIPDRGLSRSEQRRRAQALLPHAHEHLFSVCQQVAFRELTQPRPGVAA